MYLRSYSMQPSGIISFAEEKRNERREKAMLPAQWWAGIPEKEGEEVSAVKEEIEVNEVAAELLASIMI